MNGQELLELGLIVRITNECKDTLDPVQSLPGKGRTTLEVPCKQICTPRSTGSEFLIMTPMFTR